MRQEKSKFAVLGGDLRQFWVARGFQKAGYRVGTFAVMDPDGEFPQESLETALAGAEYVVLPLPSFDENGYLTADDCNVHVSQMVELLEPGVRVFGGKMTTEAAVFENASIRAVDYLCLEEMATANAIPAAFII